MKTTKKWNKGFGRNLRLAGMATMVLAFGLVLAGCDGGGSGGGDSGGSGNTDPKSITITGITDDLGGGASVVLFQSLDTSSGIADIAGTGTIVNSTLTVALFNVKDGTLEKPWTGSGKYFARINSRSGGGYYRYTDGKTFAELGITSEADMGKLKKKLSITRASTTVAFDKFKSEWDLE